MQGNSFEELGKNRLAGVIQIQWYLLTNAPVISGGVSHLFQMDDA